jgi:hypothetical protein
MNEKATKQIVSEIFGENGLIEADTTIDFTKLVTNIESKYEASVGAYLTDKDYNYFCTLHVTNDIG